MFSNIVHTLIFVSVAIIVVPLIWLAYRHTFTRKCPKCKGTAYAKPSTANTSGYDYVFICFKCDHRWYVDNSHRWFWKRKWVRCTGKLRRCSISDDLHARHIIFAAFDQILKPLFWKFTRSAFPMETVVNNYVYGMILFLVFMFGAILTTKLAYRECKKLSLSPPLPIGQYEQFRFYKFINDQSKSTEYKSLKPYVWGLWFSFLMCFVSFIYLILKWQW